MPGHRVRCTFSCGRAWRPAVVARLARTLSIRMQPTPPDPRSPKDVWDDQHKSLTDEPLAWQLKADSLIDSFEILIAADTVKMENNLSGRRFLGVAYMLAGFAIENLLKGQLVARKAHRSDGGIFKLKTHDLRQLATDAGQKMSTEQARLLERIQEFTVWTARYPVPMNSEDMRPRTTPDGGFAPRTYHHAGEDWPAIRELLVKFRHELVRLRDAR